MKPVDFAEEKIDRRETGLCWQVRASLWLNWGD